VSSISHRQAGAFPEREPWHTRDDASRCIVLSHANGNHANRHEKEHADGRKECDFFHRYVPLSSNSFLEQKNNVPKIKEEEPRETTRARKSPSERGRFCFFINIKKLK